MTLYTITAVACIIAAAMLAWRLVGCWDHTDRLVHTIGVLLVASVALASIAAAGATVQAQGTPAAVVVMALVMLHSFACVAAAIAWPALQARITVPAYAPLYHR